MSRGVQLQHLGAARSNQNSIGRINGDSIAQQTPGENGIRNRLDRNNRAAGKGR